MIFTVILLYPCLLLECLVNCKSVEVGSHIPPVASHFSSSSSNQSHIVRNNPSASNSENDPPETPSSQNSRRLRQVSTSEWIFSSLVQPDQQPSHSSPSSSPTSRQQNRRGNSLLTYRSIAPVASSSNYYTNYYRNHNIYAQAPNRDDNGNGNAQEKQRYSSSRTSQQSDPNSEGTLPNAKASAIEHPAFSLSRTRTSSSLPTTSERNGVSSVTSKTPGVVNQRSTGTTGLSRTAPATDPTMLITERPTSTQEMQISNDESSTSNDDLQLETRAEIGRKRGRELNSPLHFDENSPIYFPGKTTVSDTKVTPWPYSSPVQRHLDGWRKIQELRKKSQTYGEARKSSISSDQSADAKILSMLTIQKTPKCALKNGYGYCDDIDTYPKAFFDQVLNKSLIPPEVFTDLFGETTENTSRVTDVELKLRTDLEETPLCSVREHTIFPKAAENRKGKYMYIVNHDEYLQGVRVETCTRGGDHCMFSEGQPAGYTSVCKQKYIYKKLLAFSPDGKAMPDTFRLPSCCVCHVRSMFISDRFNPGPDVGSDIQPTVAADDSSWNSPSSTVVYPSYETSSQSSTEPDDSGGITFPTTSKDDLPSFQVPTPTASTPSSTLRTTASQQQGGSQHIIRAENQTSSRRLHY